MANTIYVPTLPTRYCYARQPIICNTAKGPEAMRRCLLGLYDTNYGNWIHWLSEAGITDCSRNLALRNPRRESETNANFQLTLEIQYEATGGGSVILQIDGTYDLEFTIKSPTSGRTFGTVDSTIDYDITEIATCGLTVPSTATVYSVAVYQTNKRENMPQGLLSNGLSYPEDFGYTSPMTPAKFNQLRNMVDFCKANLASGLFLNAIDIADGTRDYQFALFLPVTQTSQPVDATFFLNGASASTVLTIANLTDGTTDSLSGTSDVVVRGFTTATRKGEFKLMSLNISGDYADSIYGLWNEIG